MWWQYSAVLVLVSIGHFKKALTLLYSMGCVELAGMMVAAPIAMRSCLVAARFAEFGLSSGLLTLEETGKGEIVDQVRVNC